MRRMGICCCAAKLVSSVLASSARAHAPGAGAETASLQIWSMDPWAAGLLLLVGGLYLHGAWRLIAASHYAATVLRRRAGLFFCAWTVCAIALVSPIDTLGSELFSVHMVQHELLMLLAAPLLVLAASGPAFAWALPTSWRRLANPGIRALSRVWRGLARPASAWSIYALVLWVWHLPPLFAAALDSDWIHGLQHYSFLLGAVLFWWSLVRRCPGPTGLLLLFTTALHSSLLAAALTFSSRAWYSGYATTTAAWGLTPIEDQQLGGLIMWIPGGLVYWAAGLSLFARWLRRAEFPGLDVGRVPTGIEKESASQSTTGPVVSRSSL